MKPSKHYNEVNDLLDEDLHRMHREWRFAVYGYIFCLFDMQLITFDEFGQLQDRLELTNEDLDPIIL